LFHQHLELCLRLVTKLCTQCCNNYNF
jgi:hypothetical protein